MIEVFIEFHEYVFIVRLYAGSFIRQSVYAIGDKYTDTFVTVQLNGEIKKNVPVPTLSNIEKYSRTINIGRRNDANLKSHVDDAEVVKNEWTLPDLRYDIDMILDFLKGTLGSNRDEATAPTTHNKMSGGAILDKDCAISKVLKAKGNLREWITGIESRGELYERPNEADPNEEDGDGDEEEGDMDNGNEENVEDMTLIPVDEVVDEVPYVDENISAAQTRAKQYIATSGAKPSRGETEEEYVIRIASIMFGGSETRRLRSDRRGNGRNLETTMTSDEVGAAVEARKQYNQLKGNKPRKPYKILRQVTGREVGRYYVCLYRDVGYAGQDYEDTHTEDYLRQFPGFIESYQSVSVHLFLIPFYSN